MKDPGNEVGCEQYICTLVCRYTVQTGIIPKRIEFKYFIIEFKIVANLSRHVKRILTLCWHALFPLFYHINSNW